MGDKINYIFYTRERKTEKIICDMIGKIIIWITVSKT